MHTRHVLAGVGALAMFVTLSASPAYAAYETETDYAIPAMVDTHFYNVDVTKVPTAVGTPYVTTLDATSVLSLDWDFEVAVTDVIQRTSRSLGSLALPAGARVLDFQYFPEWKATSSAVPVFVSYSYVEEQTRCNRLVLREATVDSSGAGAHSLGRIWFSSPCFPRPVESPYILAQSGGRMALAPKDMRANPAKPEFFLGVGDFRIAKPYDLKMSKQARALLSTVVRIAAPGTYEVWTEGVRNPQGLVAGRVDGKRELLGTSQGPRGGDQFYVARKGANYGWPHRSYGTSYVSEDAPDRPDVEGTMRGYDEPLFDWTPSVGLSTMMQVQGPAFDRWWGTQGGKATANVIVAGLGARWLYRMIVSKGAVRGYEGLYIGARARSLAQLPNGYIVVGLDGGKELLVLTPTWVWYSPFEEKVPVGFTPSR